MGQALAGKEAGHTATYTAPGGELTVVVVEVRA
jgi:transcription elongation GreA/GreB family factor